MTNLRVRLGRLVNTLPHKFQVQDFVLLWLRCWLAHIFYASGRTKVSGGFLEPSDSAVSLFEYEYALPLLDPEWAAQLAIYGETFLPLLLIAGLFSRFGALGLVVMTLVIQIFVYPALFTEHATWLVAGLAILVKGGGQLSLDHLLFRKIGKIGTD